MPYAIILFWKIKKPVKNVVYSCNYTNLLALKNPKETISEHQKDSYVILHTKEVIIVLLTASKIQNKPRYWSLDKCTFNMIYKHTEYYYSPQNDVFIPFASKLINYEIIMLKRNKSRNTNTSCTIFICKC